MYSRLTTAWTQDDSRDGGGTIPGMESVESSRERRPRECLEHILEVERSRTPKPRKISCGIKDQARSVTPCEKCGLVSTLFLILCFCFSACGENTNRTSLLVFGGLTMGTTYTIKINEPGLNLSNEEINTGIENILSDINNKMSTYIDDSELSLLNQASSHEWIPLSSDLYEIINDAITISKLTSGGFDITVGPLVNLWGFGSSREIQQVPGAEDLSAALSHTGIEHLRLRRSPATLQKTIDNIYIDLSAIAKGYAVDKIAEYLMQHKIENYLVEIGGEIRANGSNEINFVWRIGIEQPATEKRAVQRIVKLENIAMATSGDYRNYFEENGERFSHTINPLTGLPVSHNLASVTVLHKSATWADALATGFLVMGRDAAYQIAEQENLAAFFLKRTDTGFSESYTIAFQSYLLDN